MDSVALDGHGCAWGGGSAGVRYLDLQGTQTFSLCVSDGASQQLGGCLRDFRNKPFPVRVRVEYYQQALTVSCPFYLCGVLEASPHCPFYLCGVLQASPHCPFYLCGVLQASPHCPFYLCGVLQASPYCPFYLCGVLQASPHCPFYLCGVLQALTISSVGFTWVEYYRQTFTVKFCQCYLCGVLQASTLCKFCQSVTCVECYKQAFTVKFCQSVLPVWSTTSKPPPQVLSVLPVWSDTSKPSP